MLQSPASRNNRCHWPVLLLLGQESSYSCPLRCQSLRWNHMPSQGMPTQELMSAINSDSEMLLQTQGSRWTLYLHMLEHEGRLAVLEKSKLRIGNMTSTPGNITVPSHLLVVNSPALLLPSSHQGKYNFLTRHSQGILPHFGQRNTSHPQLQSHQAIMLKHFL